jgi:hypothetical protein
LRAALIALPPGAALAQGGRSGTGPQKDKRYLPPTQARSRHKPDRALLLPPFRRIPFTTSADSPASISLQVLSQLSWSRFLTRYETIEALPGMNDLHPPVERDRSGTMKQEHRPPSLLGVFFAALGFILVSPVLLIGLTLFAFFYNDYLHPLGALDKTIEIGDPEEEVAAKFASFATEKSGTMAYYDGPAEGTIYGRNNGYDRAVALFQESIFDDVRLEVYFRNGEVAQKFFVGD